MLYALYLMKTFFGIVWLLVLVMWGILGANWVHRYFTGTTNFQRRAVKEQQMEGYGKCMSGVAAADLDSVQRFDAEMSCAKAYPKRNW